MINTTDFMVNETFRIDISDISGIYSYSDSGVHMIQMNSRSITSYTYWSMNMEAGPGVALWSSNVQ